MNSIKFILLLFLIIDTAHSFDEYRINYRQRLHKIKSINPTLAKKVEAVTSNCFTYSKFELKTPRELILRGAGDLGLLALHSFDMEKGISHSRGLDNKRKQEENHPGRLAIDLVEDMLKDEILHTKIKTYEALVKIACSANRLLGEYKWATHVTTTVEDKIVRTSGINCWDASHIAVRIANDLKIPLVRQNRGVHMFVAYRLPEFKKSKIYFALDPFYCERPEKCVYEFVDVWPRVIDESVKSKFFDREITSEKCYIDEMKKNPNNLFYYK